VVIDCRTKMVLKACIITCNDCSRPAKDDSALSQQSGKLVSCCKEGLGSSQATMRLHCYRQMQKSTAGTLRCLTVHRPLDLDLAKTDHTLMLLLMQTPLEHHVHVHCTKGHPGTLEDDKRQSSRCKEATQALWASEHSLAATFSKL
jgi:hypothetical protein